LFLARHVKGQRKAEVVKRQLQTEIVSRWGKRPLSSVTRRQIIATVDEIVNRGVRSQARNVLGNVKVFFSWCVERDMLELSPADGIKPGRLIGPKQPRQRVLTDDEIRALWAATEQMGYPYGPCYQMLLLTGQRRSEVAEARWSEFDLGICHKRPGRGSFDFTKSHLQRRRLRSRRGEHIFFAHHHNAQKPQSLNPKITAGSPTSNIA
jgi:integrase